MPDAKFPLKAVLFDLDGTLVEFKFDVRASRRAMIFWLNKNGFNVSAMNEETKTQHIIEEAEKQWNLIGKNPAGFQFVKKSLSDLLEVFEFRAFEQAKPHPGSLRLLEALGARRLMQGIVTNSGRRPVDSILDLFGFSKYMSLVITRNELGNLKPNPEGIVKALDILKIRNFEAAYVGDSTIDVEAARAAGVTSIAVATGMYGPDRLVRSEPDYLVQDIEDVNRVLFSEPI